MTTATKRVLSGMRPTGRLHIGHYFGALQNWVNLQADPTYECFYFVADWHALTSDYADTSAVAENSLQITIDYLAAGLDPDKSVVFLQSQVPEHAELHLLLSMVTPLGWLERVPTYKEALDNVKDKDLHTYGFLGYPVLQSADIVIYSEPGKGLYVPVGEDQVSHVEFSRELVRRFNNLYGWEIFRENFAKPGNDTFVRLLYNLLFRYWSDGAPEFRGTRVTAELVDWIAVAIRQVSALVGARNLIGEVNQFRQFVDSVPILTETRVPHQNSTHSRTRWPQNVQIVWQRRHAFGIRCGHSRQNQSDGHRPSPQASHRSGQSRRLPRLRLAQTLFHARTRSRAHHWVRQGCTTAGIGCIECKSAMAAEPDQMDHSGS